MEKILFAFLVLCVIVKAHHRNHHPKFPKDEPSLFVKQECTSKNAKLRNEIIEKARCGEPKDVFIELKPSVAHEIVSPGAVWVKRCVGLCDYSSCVATESVIRHIPIRVQNVRTRKETCSTYKVEEHISCGCCSETQDDCESPKIFNPRKCTCQCPNVEERKNCLQKRNQNMKWNRYSCVCEKKRNT